MINSALVINVGTSLKWESTLEPEAGSDLTYRGEVIVDATNLAERSRELRNRDGIVAANIVDVSMSMGDVWGTPQIRPEIEGSSSRELNYIVSGVGHVSSKVRYLNNSSKISETENIEDDLQGRDAMIYEALARVCEEKGLKGPDRIDPGGSSIPSIVEWSIAKGAKNNIDFNASMPASRVEINKVYQHLAYRDNILASYVANIAKILENPFSFASRLYVSVVGPGTRDPEVYNLVRRKYKSGVTYYVGDELFVGDKIYRANTVTTNDTTSGDWTIVSQNNKRVWQTSPALDDRSLIIYDVELKTLQWVDENNEVIHVPRIISLLIEGVDYDQFLKTIPEVPTFLDAYYWYRKSGRIVVSNTSISTYRHIVDTRNATGGLRQEGCNSLSVRSKTGMVLGSIGVGNYKVSILCQSDKHVEIKGCDNLEGATGIEGGVDFTGGYIPSTLNSGDPVSFNISLNKGGWNLYIDYTNLSGVTGGFSVEVTAYPGSELNSGISVVKSRTIPYYFVDENGVNLDNGTIVRSGPIAINATGEQQTYSIRWVSGTGSLHIRRLVFINSNFEESRYSLKYHIEDGGVVIGNGATADFVMNDKDSGVISHDFNVSSGLSNASVVIDWVSGDGLPLNFCQIHLEKINSGINLTPGSYGFNGWRRSCVERSAECLQDAYKKVLERFDETGVVKSYLEGEYWTPVSSGNYYSDLETYSPRFRYIENVENGSLAKGRYYRVVSGSLAYASADYEVGDLFYGVEGEESWTGTATVDQEGAFVLAGPGHVGIPGVVPRGLVYSAGLVTNGLGIKEQNPELVTLLPWMIELGVYAARPDFVN